MIDIEEGLACLGRARGHKRYSEPLFFIDSDAIYAAFKRWDARFPSEEARARFYYENVPREGTIIGWDANNEGACTKDEDRAGAWTIIDLSALDETNAKYPIPWQHYKADPTDYPEEKDKTPVTASSFFAEVLAFGLTSRISAVDSYERASSRTEQRHHHAPSQQKFSVITYRRLAPAERVLIDSRSHPIRSLRSHYVIGHQRRGTWVHRGETTYWRKGGPVRPHRRGNAEGSRQVRLVAR